ncbi:MAG: hypothetical protein Greene07147_536 [Parcubacteria group bacterium Greene0714_7]|nr:MAG: hypothetical protein Greene07147_536 [Parcubacteria group bacterium Greene0714_7]
MAEGLHPLSKPVAELTRKIRTARNDRQSQPGMLDSLVEQMMAIFSPLAPNDKNRIETEVGALLNISQSSQS